MQVSLKEVFKSLLQRLSLSFATFSEVDLFGAADRFNQELINAADFDLFLKTKEHASAEKTIN